MNSLQMGETSFKYQKVYTPNTEKRTVLDSDSYCKLFDHDEISIVCKVSRVIKACCHVAYVKSLSALSVIFYNFGAGLGISCTSVDQSRNSS